jgi:hypothetical protein
LPDARGQPLFDLRAPTPNLSRLRLPGLRCNGHWDPGLSQRSDCRPGPVAGSSDSPHRKMRPSTGRCLMPPPTSLTTGRSLKKSSEPSLRSSSPCSRSSSTRCPQPLPRCGAGRGHRAFTQCGSHSTAAEGKSIDGKSIGKPPNAAGCGSHYLPSYATSACRPLTARDQPFRDGSEP